MKILVSLFGKNHFIPGTPYEKKVDFNNYYTMELHCKNCNHYTSTYIKKGVHVNDVATHIRCSNCNVRLEKI